MVTRSNTTLVLNDILATLARIEKLLRDQVKMEKAERPTVNGGSDQ